MYEIIEETKCKYKIIKWIILMLLLIFSAGWFLSFYIKLPSTGQGVVTDVHPPMELKGFEFRAPSTE